MYNIGKQIGYGKEGTIYSVNNSKGDFAMKIVRKNPFFHYETYKKTLDDQLRFDHKNVLKTYEYSENDEVIRIISELCDTNLVLVLKDLTNYEIKSYFKQIVLGLSYLHSLNIVHRDIKPDNIFIKDGIIKIGDFGFLEKILPGTKLKKRYGSPLYTSYEIIKNIEYSFPTDIWSLGCTFYMMIHKEEIFLEYNNIDHLFDFIKEETPFTFKKSFCPLADNLIYRMLDKNPDTRITLTEILSHPFLFDL